jgi:hypothetical protein
MGYASESFDINQSVPQNPSDSMGTERSRIDEDENHFSLWGKPGPDAFYLGLWSFHASLLFNESADEQWQNHLLAIAYAGFVAGTFTNSFNNRSYVFGVHRSLSSTGDISGFSTNFGYNLAVVHGYDERLVSFADTIKFLPFVQVTYDISWKWFGIEFGYAWTVFTGGFFVYLDF